MKRVGGEMKKLIFSIVVVLLIGLGAFVGCQSGESGLSEGTVRYIVKDEVAKQFADMDRLTVSCLLIKNADGETVAALEGFEGEGSLTFYNADGEIIANLGGLNGRGNFGLTNTRGDIVVLIGSVDDDGALLVMDKDGELLFRGR